MIIVHHAVSTRYSAEPNFKGEFRVCVWGADDCGMERDFENREAEALNTFMQVIGLPDVNFQDLKQLGFVSA